MTDVFTNRLDVLLRSDLKPVLTKMFQEGTPLLKLLEQGELDMIHSMGKEFPMYVTPGGHNLYGGEGEVWPEHVPPEDIKARVRYARIYRTVSMSYDVYLHLKKLKGEALLEGYSKRLLRDTATAMKDHEQMSWGDGSGEVARVATGGVPGGATNATVTFAQSVASGNTFGAYKVRKNGYYQWYTSALVQRTDGSVTRSKCLSVNKKNNTAVFDSLPNSTGTPTIIAGDRLIPEGDAGQVVYGMKYFHRTTGYVQNLSTDTYPEIRPTVIDAGGQLIGAPILTRLKFTTAYRFDPTDPDGGTMPDIEYLWAPAQENLLNLVGQSLRRATMQDRTYDPGYDGVAFNGKKPMNFPDCDRDTVYAYPKGLIKRAELQEFGPIDPVDEAGNAVSSVQLRPATTRSGHQAILDTLFIWMGQHFCDDTHSLQAITGLDISGTPLGNDA